MGDWELLVALGAAGAARPAGLGVEEVEEGSCWIWVWTKQQARGLLTEVCTFSKIVL